jgi:hypothetical protein
MYQQYNRLVAVVAVGRRCSEITKFRETPKAYDYQGAVEKRRWLRRKTVKIR